MSNLRKRASQATKFLRIKHSASSSGDRVSTAKDSLDGQDLIRSVSSPADDAADVLLIGSPTMYSRQLSEASTFAATAILASNESVIDSPPVATILDVPWDYAIQETNGEPTLLDEVAPIVDKVRVLARSGDYSMPQRTEGADELTVWQAFQARIDAKNTQGIVLSQVKSGLADDLWFMKTLDEVARIHPFVSVAILAFKAVYTLEMTRRQNDKRIIALYKEMKEMIEVLTRLRHIAGYNSGGSDLDIIKSNIQSYVDEAAQDIKDCANACDTWMKKKTLLKVLVGPVWESKLAAFTYTFNMRRMQFEFALSIRTASVADQIKAVTDAMNVKLTALTENFRRAFSELRPADEVQLTRRLAAKGGVQAIRNDETALRELFKVEYPATPGKNGGRFDARAEDFPAQDDDGTKHRLQRSSNRVTQQLESEYTFDDFTDELREDLNTALQRNFDEFTGKFQLYYDRLQDDLRKYMREEVRHELRVEGNRVISVVTNGPHNLIRDPELKYIWEEMHWRRNVKARLFVLTLSDHFTDRIASPNTPQSDNMSIQIQSSHEADGWTHQYIDVKYLQPIMDAIDDDGSGHITIAEINRFTELMPTSLGWSLTHWLAYWAVGWQAFAARYRTEILQIYARMYAMREKVLSENRQSIEYYLWMTWDIASQLAKSLRAPVTKIPDHVEQKFSEYVRFEEERVRKNLFGIKYNIDALETVYGIVGPGRIEKHVLMLLCLILRRDLELFQLATRVQLHDDEIRDSAESISWIFEVVRNQHQDLVARFQQQKIDVEKQIKAVSCELFDYYHDSLPYWRLSNLTTAYEQEPTDEQLPGAQLKGLPPNNYPVCTDWPYRCQAYDTVVDEPWEADLRASDIIRPFLGRWNGFIFDDDGYAIKLMHTFYAHVLPSGGKNHIEAQGFNRGVLFILRGSISQEGATLKIRAVVEYARDIVDKHYSGTLMPDGSIRGSQGHEEDESLHVANFVWLRIPAELMAMRPMFPYNIPSKISNSMVPNKARALFDYAIRAVIYQIRRKTWSWQHFKERRDARLRYLDYRKRLQINGGLDPDATDPVKRNQALQPIVPADRDFYESIWDRFWRTYPQHFTSCDVCNTRCHGIQYTCLKCVDNATEDGRYEDTLDFCSLACSRTTIHPNPAAVRQPHDSSHNLLKKRTILQHRDLPLAYRQAKTAVKACQRQFSHRSLQHASPENEDIDEAMQATGADLSKDNTKPPACSICHRSVAMPCWFCVDCFHRHGAASSFLCENCEENTLLACITCKKPFKQPRWFYGLEANDTFMCNTCTAKRVPIPVQLAISKHTYLHDIVYCHKKKETPIQRSASDRLVAVESTVIKLHHKISAIDAKLINKLDSVDARVGNLGSKFDEKLDWVSNINPQLGNHLSSVDARAGELDRKVDSVSDRLSRVEGSLERIERMLGQLVTSQQF